MVHAGAAGLFGVIAALVALACLSAQLGPGRAALISAARRGAAGSADQHADTGRGQTVATRLLRSQTLSGAFVGALVKGIKHDVKHVERDGAALQSVGAGRGQLPSIRQVLKLRKKRSAERARKADHYRQELSAHLVDCKGKSEAECDMVLDAETLGNIFQPLSAQQEAVELLQLNRFQASAQELQRRMGGGSYRAGSASLTTLERQEADLEKQNSLERQIHALLQDNAKLARRNAQLSKAGAGAADKGVKRAQQLHAHVQLDSSVLGNPPGFPELVPSTVSAEPPEKPDFNGATAMIARLPPGVGYGPSLLDANGVEERGSFTLRKANPYGGIWIRAYGKMNHPIKCTLKGYRKLGGMFMGQTVYTGYKKSWSGKTTISTGIIPPGSSNTFDLVTCRDMQTGEVQHFRTNPTPSPGFFSDPGDPEFQDEYTSHAINPDHP
jgi:hypothetical protein